jgi:hypothetical protein
VRSSGAESIPYETIDDVDETAYWEPKLSYLTLAARYADDPGATPVP